MNIFGEHLLSWIAFSPLLAAALTVVMPNDKLGRWVGLAGSLLVLALSIAMYANFDAANAGYQFLVQKEWLPAIGVKYALGVDGINLYFVLLTTFLTPVVLASAWRAIGGDGARKYFALMLALESAVLGAFLSLDLFLFYIFWEVMLIPTFFLIGIWGFKDRIYAAQKFLLYTFVGSVPMLVAIIYLVLQTKVQLGFYSAGVSDVLRLTLPGDGALSVQGLLFLAFALAFAVKVPLFPLHTWLPDAYVQAPTGGTVMLSAVLAKLGGYGLIRFAMPLTPAVLPQYAPWMMGLAAIAIVYGAIVAMAQDDIKRLIAYSSLSHMGYVVFGLFALNQIGATGAVFQMVSHGISTGALFLLAGLLYERKHSRAIHSFNGLAKSIPLFAITMLIVSMSSVALPGTNGFIGEFLVLQGGFLANPWFTVVAGLGVILGAVYMLGLCQRVLFGVPDEDKSHALHDLNWREFAYLAPLVVLIGVMGLYPKALLGNIEPSIAEFTKRITVSAPAAASAPAPAETTAGEQTDAEKASH